MMTLTLRFGRLILITVPLFFSFILNFSNIARVFKI